MASAPPFLARALCAGPGRIPAHAALPLQNQRNAERTTAPAAGSANLGHCPQQARPVAAVRQHARHAVLPRLRLGAVLAGGIQAPLQLAARQDARAQARRRRGAGRPEPLELRRRHDLADRSLGVAFAVLLRAGAVRWRADHDLFDGRHARRSRAPPGRGRGEGRAPQPQRPVRPGDGRAPARIETRTRTHRPDGNRPAPRRLHAGQSVQHAAPGTTRCRDRVHQELPARSCGDSQRRGTGLRAQGRCSLPERHGGDGGPRQARREGIRD